MTRLHGRYLCPFPPPSGLYPAARTSASGRQLCWTSSGTISYFLSLRRAWQRVLIEERHLTFPRCAGAPSFRFPEMAHPLLPGRRYRAAEMKFWETQSKFWEAQRSVREHARRGRHLPPLRPERKLNNWWRNTRPSGAASRSAPPPSSSRIAAPVSRQVATNNSGKRRQSPDSYRARTCRPCWPTAKRSPKPAPRQRRRSRPGSTCARVSAICQPSVAVHRRERQVTGRFPCQRSDGFRSGFKAEHKR
jgi:hypothetical protein